MEKEMKELLENKIVNNEETVATTQITPSLDKEIPVYSNMPNAKAVNEKIFKKKVKSTK